MGFLPLMIALSGVLFLWFSVVRESLRKRLKRLTDADEKTKELLRDISNKVTQLTDNQQNNFSESDELTDFLISKEEFGACENVDKRLCKAAERLAEDSRRLAKKTPGPAGEQLKETGRLAQELNLSGREYLSALKDYNYSVEIPSARFFARLSGFKTV